MLIDPRSHAQLLESLFPNLCSSGYSITSPKDGRYNCIAWAAGDTTQPWWPIKPRYWPVDYPERATVDSFVHGFGALGYVPCDNDVFEEGIEKIAIYAKDGRPTHAARQLPNGRWTSKLGLHVDVEHEVVGLDSEEYGLIVQFLKRPRALTTNRR